MLRTITISLLMVSLFTIEVNLKKYQMNLYFKRFVSFFVDIIIFGFIGGLLALIFDKINSLSFLDEYVFYFLLSLFIFRDLFSHEGSIGKSILKIKIVDSSRQKKNFILRKILRNVTSLIWPIEAIVLISINSRISDRLLNLDVVSKE